MDRAPRVVKLGGSLLDDAHLARRLRAWLASERDRPLVLIVGGGRSADWIRQAERLHDFSTAAAHRLAIRAMSFNTHLVRELLPELTYYRGGVGTMPRSRRTLYDLAACDDVGMTREGEPCDDDGSGFANEQTALHEAAPLAGSATNIEPDGELRGTARLPIGWHVTSDSIAAWLAGRLDAAELVLLKSVLPTAETIEGLSRSGYCDAYFGTALGGVPVVRCVDLRRDPPAERRFVRPDESEGRRPPQR